MKETAAYSPFAALDSREQKERWICWQSQHLAEQPVSKPTEVQGEPESVLTLSKPTESRLLKTPRGNEYTSVVRRIQQAAQKAQRYVAWSDADSTTQPSSGS